MLIHFPQRVSKFDGCDCARFHEDENLNVAMIPAKVSSQVGENMTVTTILMIADCGNNSILGLIIEMFTSFQAISVKTTG